MADEGGEQAGVAGDVEARISDADADTLIAEAVRRRDEQQSGRSMGTALPIVAGCAVAGLGLISAGRLLGRGVAAVTLAAGVLIIAVAGLFLLRALDLSPATQWGEPVGEPCPACGDRGLREDRVTVGEVNSIVALCTPECGYADARPDPHTPESRPGGLRRSIS